jgi:hypothetical protein
LGDPNTETPWLATFVVSVVPLVVLVAVTLLTALWTGRFSSTPSAARSSAAARPRDCCTTPVRRRPPAVGRSTQERLTV